MKRTWHRRERPPAWSRFGWLEFAFWLPVTFLAFLGVGAAMHHWPVIMPLAYLGMSGATAIFYARDKGKALREEWRTPETMLHTLDLLGGWPGGLIAQRVYRHKTRKVWFQIIFWLGTLAHLAFWGWIFVAIPAEQDLLRFCGRVGRAILAEFLR